MAFQNPQLTATGGGLYLRWDPPAKLVLARISPAQGEIVAMNRAIPGTLGAPTAAAGALWVVAATSDGQYLMRLAPQTLQVTGRVKMTGGPSHIDPVDGDASHVAYAGGSIWADGSGVLVQVTPSSMTLRRVITLPRANSSDVGASTDGSTLIVSYANSGNGTIQRRDPATGAVLASSAPIAGVVAPMIEGVSGAGVWISEPTGMMGYVERLTTATLAEQSKTQVEGTNGIRAGVWNGMLWVTSPVGGSQRNYCASLATGARLAALSLPNLSQDILLTVAGHTLYYAADSGSGFRIHTGPVPAGCQ